MLVFFYVAALFALASALRILTPPAGLTDEMWQWLTLLILITAHVGAGLASFNARYSSFSNSLFWIIAGGVLPLVYVIHWPLYASINLPGEQLLDELTALFVVFVPAALFYLGPLLAAFQPRPEGNTRGTNFTDYAGMIVLLGLGMTLLTLNLAQINMWYETWRGYIAVLTLGDACAADLTAPGCQVGFQLWELAPWAMGMGQVIGVLAISLPKTALLRAFRGRGRGRRR